MNPDNMPINSYRDLYDDDKYKWNYAEEEIPGWSSYEESPANKKSPAVGDLVRIKGHGIHLITVQHGSRLFSVAGRPKNQVFRDDEIEVING